MQIQQINHKKINEQGAYLSTEGARTQKVGDISSFYAFNDETSIKEAQTTEKIAAKAKSLTDGQTENHAEFVADVMSPELMGKASEEGVELDKEEEEVSLTVVDKIQMKMIEAGNEAVSRTADLSAQELASMSQAVASAYEMAKNLSTPTKEEIDYLVANELEPTIGNLYQAKAVNSTLDSAKEMGYSKEEEDVAGLESAIEKKLGAFGVEATKEDVERATKMVKAGIPLTRENYGYYRELEGLKLPLSDEKIEASITKAMMSGRSAACGMMLDGYSYQDRAIETARVVENATTEDVDYLISQGLDVNVSNLSMAKGDSSGKTESRMILTDTQQYKALVAYRRLEQTRLIMTTEANLALLKKGIHIETESLEKLVAELEEQEKIFLEKMYYRSNPIDARAAKELHMESMEAIENVKQAPAYLMNEMDGDTTFTEAKDMALSVSSESKAEYTKANGAYETMQTEVRTDLGDSMKKAFRNVDDILQDLDLETSASNQRAVRMLAYNRVDITVENIATMKEKDEQMQNLFKNLTPKVVLSMIREGFNPLDATLTELNEKAKEIASGLDSQDAEKYSKFLYQMEKSGSITAEEKESFIGVYRLLHQIEKSDGAAVGAAVMAGEKLTMRNLMTQVRNQKASPMELKADDASGEKVGNKVADLSITQQIEFAYQVLCAENSLKDFTPAQYKQIGEKLAAEGKDIFDLTPEELLELQRQLEGQGQSEEEVEFQIEEQARTKEMVSEAYTILHNNAQVEEYLTKYEVNKTPENILAVADMLKNRNKVFKDLYEASQKDELMGELADAKYELWQHFAESVKTPEEMAKAQEELGDLAESIMENMIMEQDATSIDIDSMRMCCRQLSILSHASKKEDYAVPVLVQNEMGVVSLKIVRGKEEKGKVTITMDTERAGKIAAEFSVENFRLKGYVVAENQVIQEMLERRKGNLEKAMLEHVEETSFMIVTNPAVSLEQFGKGASVDGSMDNEVQTKTLYGIAQSFINVLQTL